MAQSTPRQWSERAFDRRNVLFFITHDMRFNGRCAAALPACTRHHTPNLDALARESLLLTKHYAQAGVCAPSRTSLLTSRRPDTTRVYDLFSYWREVGGNFTTLPQLFGQLGYITAGIGTVFHGGGTSGGGTADNIGGQDRALSWVRRFWSPMVIIPVGS